MPEINYMPLNTLRFNRFIHKVFCLMLLVFSPHLIADHLSECHPKKGKRINISIFCGNDNSIQQTDSRLLKNNKRIYKGKQITLDLEGVEANKVFRLLANASDYSLIMDASIDQYITLKKTTLPWNQALYELAEFLKLKAKIYNNIIYVDLNSALRKYRPRTKTYQGSIISLNFNDIESAVLLKILADHAGKSLAINTTIDKRISIVRNNIPWDQALIEITEFLALDLAIDNKHISINEIQRRNKRLKPRSQKI